MNWNAVITEKYNYTLLVNHAEINKENLCQLYELLELSVVIFGDEEKSEYWW